jgi:type I restriction enzyme S subunit
MNVTRDGRIDRTDLRLIAPALADHPGRRLRYGDILFNNTNSLSLVGKTALFDGEDEPAFSNHMTRLRVKSEVADSAYVARLLHSRWQEGVFRQLANSHVSQASISRSVLESLSLTLPPLTEQHRIIARIEEADTGFQLVDSHLLASQSAIDSLNRAVLSAACSGRLTADWREGHPGVTAEPLVAELEQSRGRSIDRRQSGPEDGGLTSEGQLESLPSSWDLVRLGDICDVATGATPLRGNQEFYEDGTVPWVTSGAVNAGIITFPTERITPLALEQTSVKLFPVGTLLIAMYGEGQTRGRVAELAIEAGTNQAVAAVLFTAVTARLRPFLRMFFEDSYRRMRVRSAGGVQPNLNLGLIRDTLLPLPPYEEQVEIVRRVTFALKAANHAAGWVQKATGELQRIQKATLARAFQGRLVPTEAELASSADRSFESGEELLGKDFA